MALSGVFDRYPDLTIIFGHWGEMIPVYLESAQLSDEDKHLIAYGNSEKLLGV